MGFRKQITYGNTMQMSTHCHVRGRDNPWGLRPTPLLSFYPVKMKVVYARLSHGANRAGYVTTKPDFSTGACMEAKGTSSRSRCLCVDGY